MGCGGGGRGELGSESATLQEPGGRRRVRTRERERLAHRRFDEHTNRKEGSEPTTGGERRRDGRGATRRETCTQMNTHKKKGGERADDRGGGASEGAPRRDGRGATRRELGAAQTHTGCATRRHSPLRTRERETCTQKTHKKKGAERADDWGGGASEGAPRRDGRGATPRELGAAHPAPVPRDPLGDHRPAREGKGACVC